MCITAGPCTGDRLRQGAAGTILPWRALGMEDSGGLLSVRGSDDLYDAGHHDITLSNRSRRPIDNCIETLWRPFETATWSPCQFRDAGTARCAR